MRSARPRIGVGIFLGLVLALIGGGRVFALSPLAALASHITGVSSDSHDYAVALESADEAVLLPVTAVREAGGLHLRPTANGGTACVPPAGVIALPAYWEAVRLPIYAATIDLRVPPSAAPSSPRDPPLFS